MPRSGSPFVDVGIIGLPPKEGYSPFLHVVRSRRGEDSRALDEFGIKVNVIDGPVGAASALKMSYAGITKGITAVGSMMMLAATRAGVADKLRGELERSHRRSWRAFSAPCPTCSTRRIALSARWRKSRTSSARMGRRRIYQAIAEFYTRIAADHEGKHEETGALAAFLKKKD